jgi:hypothetical protein
VLSGCYEPPYRIRESCLCAFSCAASITLDVVPEVTTSILDHVSFFNNENKKPIAVKVKAGKDNIEIYK